MLRPLPTYHLRPLIAWAEVHCGPVIGQPFSKHTTAPWRFGALAIGDMI